MHSGLKKKGYQLLLLTSFASPAWSQESITET